MANELIIWGEVVRATRTKANVSLEELARRVDKEATFIEQVEEGKTTMTAHELVRIAFALGSHPSDLIDEVLDKLEVRG